MEKKKMLLAVGIGALIFGAGAVSGALFSLFIDGTINADTGYILQWSDTGVWGGEEVNAEDYNPTITYSGLVGGDTDVKLFYMRCNSNLDSAITTEYTITDDGIGDNPTGLTIALQYDNSGTWTDIFNFTASASGSTSGTFTFNPSDVENFRLWCNANEYMMEGEHAFNFEMDYYAP